MHKKHGRRYQNIHKKTCMTTYGLKPPCHSKLHIKVNTQKGVRLYSNFHCGPWDIVTVVYDIGWLQMNDKYTELNLNFSLETWHTE